MAPEGASQWLNLAGVGSTQEGDTISQSPWGQKKHEKEKWFGLVIECMCVGV